VEVGRGHVQAVAVDPLTELQIHWNDPDAELPRYFDRKIRRAVSDDGDHAAPCLPSVPMLDSGETLPGGPARERHDRMSTEPEPDAPPLDQARAPERGAPEEEATFRTVLRSPGFARLLVGQSVSSLGDWVATFAFIAAASTLSHGNQTAIAVVLVLRLVPPIFAAPVGGVVADRLYRRTIM